MTTPTPLIEVQDLSKSYGPVRALRGVSFRVEEGEVLGFLGLNGAGKSTTLRILAGFLPGDEGTVRVAGYDVDRESLQVRSLMGYLPEGVPLYPDMRVSEYLRFRCRLKGIRLRQRGRQIGKVLEETGTANVRRRVIGTLSRGYRQRVGLADCLLGEPKVLVLDEPTVGLDPVQQRQFRALLREVGRERTVVLSTHILSEVERVCTKVLVIHEGRIRASGTADTFGRRRGHSPVVAQIDGPEERVAATLESLPGVFRVERSDALPPPPRATGESGCQFRLHTEKGTDVRPAVAAAVQREGWLLLELKEERRSFEDAFIDLVGREP